MTTQTTLKAFSVPQTSQRRIAGIGFVIAVHAALLYALFQGLLGPAIGPIKLPANIQAFVIEPPKPAKPVPPKPVPQRVFVPQPEVPAPQITPDTSPTITATAEPQPQPVSSAAQSVAGTHTIPDYPPISRRLGEEGIVTLRVAISDTGGISDVTVMKSSGYPRLDEAAAAWVKAHWRYQPAIENGRPVASAASAQVKFELH